MQAEGVHNSLCNYDHEITYDHLFALGIKAGPRVSYPHPYMPQVLPCSAESIA